MAGRTSRKNNDDRIGPARLVGLAFVAAVALVFGWALTKLLSPGGLHLGARTTGNVRDFGALLHADDRTLTLSFVGANPSTTAGSDCWEGYDVVATEDPTTVRIEVK